MRGTTERETAIVDLFQGLKLPCRYIEEMLRLYEIETVKANLAEIDGVLLGNLLAINRNLGLGRQAFAELHGLYHLLRAGPGIVLPL